MPLVLPIIRTAGEILFTPVGNIASADVQAALAELDTEKVPYSGASGAVNLGAHNLTTTGAGTFGNMTIFSPTPILVFKDSDGLGAASVGYIEWRDSGGGRAGFFGNSSAGDDDLLWKNEQGGNIEIQTTGAGKVQILTGILQVGNAISFTQTDDNEFIDSLNDGYMDYGATTGHRFDNDIILSKTSGNGIKVDTATPTFPWRDLTGAIVVKVTGAGRPSFITYKGNIEEYQFAINDKAEFTYHIPHDYVPGSDIHLHVHWSHISAAVTGGTITFGYELVYAKGHNQAPFGTNKVGTIVATASATQYQHIVSEIQISAASPSGSQIDSDDLEPDGLILIELFLNANNMTGATPDPFVHEMDVHYQSTNIGTKQKAPNFYT